MDAMVVIILSKITLLQNLAENIRVVIPHKVFEFEKGLLDRIIGGIEIDG